MKGLHLPSFTWSNKVSPLSESRSTFKNKIMIVLATFMFFNVMPKVAFSNQVSTEISDEEKEQTKEEFVDDIVKGIRSELEICAKNNSGKVPYMWKEKLLVKMKKNPFFEKMLFRVFTSPNPSEHGITLIGQCAPKSAQKIVWLDEKKKKSFHLKYVSGELQKELNILMYDKRHESMNKLLWVIWK